MDPAWKAVFFGAAVLVYALACVLRPPDDRTRLVAVGLALFTVPFFWDAVEAA